MRMDIIDLLILLLIHHFNFLFGCKSFLGGNELKMLISGQKSMRCGPLLLRK